MISKQNSVRSTLCGTALLVAGGFVGPISDLARADNLNLTKAEHTPFDCQKTLTVEELSTFKASKPNKRYRLELSSGALANPYLMALVYGAFKAADDAGVDLQLDNARGAMDAASQITQLENGLSRGADALLISPTDPNAVIASVDEAASKMPVIDIGTLSNSTKSYKLVQDDYSQGKMAADTLNKLLPDGGEGIMIAGPANHSWARRRVAGFTDQMKLYPKLKINEIANEDIRPDEGLAKFVNAAQAHPKVDWIYTVAAAILPPTSIPPEYKKAVFVAGGHYKYVDDALRDGSAAASLPDFPVWVGYVGVSFMIDKLNGGDLVQRTCIPIAAVTKADLDKPYWRDSNIIPPNWAPPNK
jgi:ribose transport system substrate-binding protein